MTVRGQHRGGGVVVGVGGGVSWMERLGKGAGPALVLQQEPAQA
jgi:hypothetical protein